jgi:hypothetical protein
MFNLKTLHSVANILRNLGQFQGFSFLSKNVSKKFLHTKYLVIVSGIHRKYYYRFKLALQVQYFILVTD